jgi:hypothetical protein
MAPVVSWHYSRAGQEDGMFGRFKKKPETKLWPEARWTVSVDDSGFHVTDHTGDTRTVTVADLSGVAIETNDNGPLGADVWWLLFGADRKLACAFPQGATGDKVVIDHLMKLPNFDFKEMTNAMCSTDDATFALWHAEPI